MNPAAVGRISDQGHIMNTHPSRRLVLGAGIAAALMANTVRAATAEIYTRAFSDLAIGGYDPVAYFTQGQPVKGDSSFSHKYKGATWRFASAANRDLFIANPDKYEPQFGGYCAWAVAQGDTASGDPLKWKIVDNKLFLNYDDAVQKKWEADIPGFIRKANQNWPRILGR
jgi:YHS domain-containing protein